MTMLEALRGARALAAEGWRRGENYGVDDGGGSRAAGIAEYLRARSEGHPHSCCVSGGLIAVMGSDPALWEQTASVLRDAHERPSESWKWTVPEMNDALGSQEEALAWLDRAIEIAKEEEA